MVSRAVLNSQAWQFREDLTPPAGPWSFTATDGQTGYTATGSAGFTISVEVNGQPIRLTEDYTRAGNEITFLIPLSAGDFVEIIAPPVLRGLTFDSSAVQTPSIGGNLDNFLVSRAREIWITDAPYLADPTGVTDSAAAFRAARDFLSAIGGGVIRMPPRSMFRFSTTETHQIWEISAQQTRTANLVLPAGVSLIGAGRETTKIFTSGTAASSGVIIPLDAANQKIGGFELQGNGSQSNAAHGIFAYSSESYAHILANVEYFDLYIHDVGSYGLGNNLECQGVYVEGVKTRRTGADGIDWKQRGTSLLSFVNSRTIFRDIDIDEYGQRAGAGSPSGIGFRGPVQVDGISVKGVVQDVGNVTPGIQFVAGIVTPGDIRISAAQSTITNWYVEGADPKGDAVGLSIFSCAAVRVGVGVAKYARCEAVGRTTSPYGFDDGGFFEGATVIPAHGRTAFRTTARGTHMRGARIISDKVYWDARRGNLVAGQTVLPLPFSSDTNDGAPRFMVKIVTVDDVETRTILTETTDYTWGSNFVTLVTPAAETDQFFAVFPPATGFRIEAFNCSVLGVQDYYVPTRISISTQPQADSGEFHIMWEGRANIGQINSSVNMGLMARDVTVTDKDFRIQAQGAGGVVIGAADNKLAFFTGSGATKRNVETTGATVEQKIDRLTAAFVAYGAITTS